MLSVTAITSKAYGYLKPVEDFFFEMPLHWDLTAVIGIALLILKPIYAPPLLIIAGSALLMRLVVKVLEHYNPQILAIFREKILIFGQNNAYLKYSSIAPCLIYLILPVGGIIFALGVGIYTGLQMETDVNKNKQDARRGLLDVPRDTNQIVADII